MFYKKKWWNNSLIVSHLNFYFSMGDFNLRMVFFIYFIRIYVLVNKYTFCEKMKIDILLNNCTKNNQLIFCLFKWFGLFITLHWISMDDSACLAGS
ncbi:hypothetical protein D6S13_23955 [Salmonella enterica subsp. enterica]|nr:hypothetical protein [Salmonella enterica subsp. enterica]